MTLTSNADGTWTQVSGLKTSTFPVDKEFTVFCSENFEVCNENFMKDSWGDKELTGFVTLDGTKMIKVFKVCYILRS